MRRMPPIHRLLKWLAAGYCLLFLLRPPVSLLLAGHFSLRGWLTLSGSALPLAAFVWSAMLVIAIRQHAPPARRILKWFCIAYIAAFLLRPTLTMLLTGQPTLYAWELTAGDALSRVLFVWSTIGIIVIGCIERFRPRRWRPPCSPVFSGSATACSPATVRNATTT